MIGRDGPLDYDERCERANEHRARIKDEPPPWASDEDDEFDRRRDLAILRELDEDEERVYGVDWNRIRTLLRRTRG